MDGFLDPLPSKAVDHISSWALYCGGAEIIAAKASPELTRQVLANLLKKNLSHIMYLHGWQIAVDKIADEALDMYIERARDRRTNSEELESLSSLIGELSPSYLSPGRWHDVATDSTLPVIIRLAGYRVAPGPVPLDAWLVIDEIIRLSELDQDYLYAHRAFGFYWRMQDAQSKFIELLNNPAIPEKRIRKLLEGLLRSDLATDVKRSVLRRAIDSSTPSQNILFLMLLCLAIWGDEKAEEEMIPMLLDQDFENLTAWLYQANKFSERSVRSAAEILASRPMSSKHLFRLIGAAEFGLSFKTEAHGFSGAAGIESFIHPARADMLNHLSTNLRDDDKSLDALKIRVQVGVAKARERLIAETRNYLAGFQQFMSYDDDTNVSSAIYVLEQGGTLPSDFLLEIIDKSTSNAGRAAINRLILNGDEKTIQELLERYNSRAQDFVREGIFSGLETLAGRYGKRIVRDNDQLVVE